MPNDLSSTLQDLTGWLNRVEVELLDSGWGGEELTRILGTLVPLGARGAVVPSARVVQAVYALEDSSVQTICAVGSPWGTSDGDVKRYEVEMAIDSGAQGFEWVIAPGVLKNPETKALVREWRDAVEAAEERPVRVRVDASRLHGAELLSLASLLRGTGVAGLTLELPGNSAPVLTLLEGIRENLEESVELKASVCHLDSSSLLDFQLSGASMFGVRGVPVQTG